MKRKDDQPVKPIVKGPCSNPRLRYFAGASRIPLTVFENLPEDSQFPEWEETARLAGYQLHTAIIRLVTEDDDFAGCRLRGDPVPPNTFLPTTPEVLLEHTRWLLKWMEGGEDDTMIKILAPKRVREFWSAMRRMNAMNMPVEPVDLSTVIACRQATDEVVRWCETDGGIGRADEQGAPTEEDGQVDLDKNCQAQTGQEKAHNPNEGLLVFSLPQVFRAGAELALAIWEGRTVPFGNRDPFDGVPRYSGPIDCATGHLSEAIHRPKFNRLTWPNAVKESVSTEGAQKALVKMWDALERLGEYSPSGARLEGTVRTAFHLLHDALWTLFSILPESNKQQLQALVSEIDSKWGWSAQFSEDSSSDDERNREAKKARQKRGRHRNKPGRPVQNDPAEDKRVCEDWEASELPTIKEFARARGVPYKQAKASIERHQKRRERAKDRPTN